MTGKYWLQTFTGKVFNVYDPQPDQVDIEDIANALSLLCRYNGHLAKFYSVAQHSVLCSLLVERGFELEALLHDSCEAYIGDMPSPVKRGQPSFNHLERMIWDDAIAPKFGLGAPSKEVKKADLQMLALEKKFLIRDYGYDWQLDEIDIPSNIQNINPLGHHLAKDLFLNRFWEITK